MTIALLKTFLAISEHGSFSAAADRIFITHAAVGQQMKRLEDLVQVELFDRTNRSPELNDTGKAFVPKARAVVEAYDGLMEDLVGTGQLEGELTLGAVPSSIRELIPRAIKKLVVAYPDLHFRVVPGLSIGLHEQVERGGLDAALIAMPSHIGAHLEWFPFVEEELVLLAAPNVTPVDPIHLIKTKPYISHTRRASVHQLAEDWLLKNKLSVQPSMEMESLETMVSMIYHDLGVSIAPNLCVPDKLFQELTKIPLRSTGNIDSLGRVLGLLMRKNCPKANLVRRFLLTIEQTVQETKIMQMV